MDDHELSKLAETLDTGDKSLIKGNPEDRGIGKYGNAENWTVLKKEWESLLERKGYHIDLKILEEINQQIKDGKLKEISLERLLTIAQKSRPQRTETHSVHEFTLGELILKMEAERKKYHTIDAEVVDG